MLKILVVAAAVAFAVGIIVGANFSSSGTSGTEQILNIATPASSNVPQLDASDPRQMTNGEQLDTQIEVLNILGSSISYRNAERRLLLSEIARLQMLKADLEAEIDGLVSVR